MNHRTSNNQPRGTATGESKRTTSNRVKSQPPTGEPPTPCNPTAGESTHHHRAPAREHPPTNSHHRNIEPCAGTERMSTPQPNHGESHRERPTIEGASTRQPPRNRAPSNPAGTREQQPTKTGSSQSPQPCNPPPANRESTTPGNRAATGTLSRGAADRQPPAPAIREPGEQTTATRQPPAGNLCQPEPATTANSTLQSSNHTGTTHPHSHTSHPPLKTTKPPKLCTKPRKSMQTCQNTGIRRFLSKTVKTGSHQGKQSPVRTKQYELIHHGHTQRQSCYTTVFYATPTRVQSWEVSQKQISNMFQVIRGSPLIIPETYPLPAG